jgi:hypothetical protein
MPPCLVYDKLYKNAPRRPPAFAIIGNPWSGKSIRETRGELANRCDRSRFGERCERSVSRSIAGVAAVAAIVSLLGVGAVGGTARARPAAPADSRANAKQHAPLRAIFYLAAPASTRGRAGRPAPIKHRGAAAGTTRDLAALKWAHADAAIMPWSRQGSAADRRLRAVLAAITSHHAHVRVAALIDRQRGSEVSQLRTLASRRAAARSYLHIGSKPAVFVALADRAHRNCGAARRWRAAAGGFWLAQATFAGYGECRGSADAWFGHEARARSSHAPGTYLVRPGFWPRSAKAPRLRRSANTWRASVERMNASGASFQLIDSLDDWAHGTAIEPSAAWRSRSSFGRYLDVLHAHSPGHAPVAQPPSVEAVAIAGATAHRVSVVAAVAPGSKASKWWVEFGATTAYGKVTAPAPVAAASSPKPATTELTSLAASTTYHARVVAASSAGVVASDDSTFTTLAESRSMRVAAAGDIACDPESSSFNGGAGSSTACHQLGVSNAIIAGAYDGVLALGDLQYNSATASQFAGSYVPSWGRFRSITHPVVGNHEYGSPDAAPYFDYFGAAAGDPDKGYYSYDLGSWHMIALNANCAKISGCSAGTPQELWLRADLAAHPMGCTLAYWHQPRFSSGQHGDDTATSALWDDLYAAGAELVLSGHDHDYERFAPQDGQGARDDARGIREFVVGTGGNNHTTFKAAIRPNSEVRDASTFGYLELTLGDGAYSWRFVSDPPGGFADSGTGSCH